MAHTNKEAEFSHEDHFMSNSNFGYDHYPEGASPPPQYQLAINPQGGNFQDAKDGYPQSRQGYPTPGSGYVYPPPDQEYVFPQQRQGYPAPGQGYAPYGQQQQQNHTNVVVTQPYVVHQQITGPAPQDHMSSAICVTLCCFCPTGIVAIMRASEARSALARGDLAGAHAAARGARSMVTASIIIGFISFILYAAIVVLRILIEF